MAKIERFKQIEAWQTAREMTRLVYQLTNQGAFARDFGLRDQMRRAAVSVMSNQQLHVAFAAGCQPAPRPARRSRCIRHPGVGHPLTPIRTLPTLRTLITLPT